jgi:hypothetical protein
LPTAGGRTGTCEALAATGFQHAHRPSTSLQGASID